MSDPNIGRLLRNRYQLQDMIGTGAMGKVYLAKDTLLGGVPVAVKFLSLSLQNPRMRVQDRFEKEAKTCALLGQKSIHIVRVMDYGVDEQDTPFYVMEYLQGKSLSEVIRRQQIPLTRFLNMARQISLGLACAHDGIMIDGMKGEKCPIIHRDIKPSNMLVIQDPSFGELVKVLDFGIAKLLLGDSNNTNYYLGTLAYSSPEQMEGKELDNRSDIYSLGVMLFEMLTGKLPLQPTSHNFGAWYHAHQKQMPRSFAEVAPRLNIPSEVQNLVMSCLAKSPSDRPQSMNEILETIVALEQRYGNQGIWLPPKPSSSTLDTPTTPEKFNSDNRNVIPVASLSTEEIARLTPWPKNRPIADIAFPDFFSANEESFPAVWAMLPQQEIQKRLVSTRYNQFLFITAPHPMVLWITVIHNRQHGAKWLPCYLDLKLPHNQKMIRLLGNLGSYYLLFFAREAPQRTAHVTTSSIAFDQRQRLQKWAALGQTLVSTADPRFSRNLLRNEYEKIKPQIIAKLESIHTDSPFDISS